ncbi:VWA domain containing CoxE-like protein [Candidatus Promineifilum breve]|uniref:VWA domain containing CoxE-like protein n=1 Tax=Candidatus Promineifilum breve TaxID=1806508 RepID=A0A160T943_9CHLR|nr:VWA domain-containing protein [Candidatus Promineifilum breve]CUS05968.1 VWA domain containing CoxE-like protein [Candidatus Promineifilum breve]
MNEHDERTRRWRLVLGGEEEQGSGGAGEQGGEGAAGDKTQLSPRDKALDEALGALYGESHGGDLSKSSPDVARWLGDIRAYFPDDVVQVIQRDALRRMDARRLIEHPELLAQVEPDAALAATLLSLRKVMPPRTQETARQVVARVVADLTRRLELPLRQAISGSLNRAARAHRPRRLQEIDWNRTIRANLKHYQPALGTVIPEKLVGYGRRRPTLKDVILLVDTSGSMATSVVYAGIAAAVLASIPALNTRLVMFDTAVVDLTDQLDDPVAMLFGVRLGGGTNIDRALTYARASITRPRDTVVILISDLFEGGSKPGVVRQVAALLADGVAFIALLALNDQGAPRYDAVMAQELADLGARAFACTPEEFPELMGRALNGKLS